MAKTSSSKKMLRWASVVGGLILLYYTGSTVLDLIRIRAQKSRLERERVYLKARTLAVEFRTRALENPEVIRAIARKRLGMRDTSHSMVEIPDTSWQSPDSGQESRQEDQGDSQ